MSSYWKCVKVPLLESLFTQNRRMFRSLPKNKTVFDVEDLNDFEKNVKCSSKPVVVDFHASWCTPCKLLAPRLESVVSEQGGAVQLARVDIDELTDLALDYNIASVPSLLVMHNGKVLKRLVGVPSADYLRTWIDRSVKHARRMPATA